MYKVLVNRLTTRQDHLVGIPTCRMREWNRRRAYDQCRPIWSNH